MGAKNRIWSLVPKVSQACQGRGGPGENSPALSHVCQMILVDHLLDDPCFSRPMDRRLPVHLARISLNFLLANFAHHASSWPLWHFRNLHLTILHQHFSSRRFLAVAEPCLVAHGPWHLVTRLTTLRWLSPKLGNDGTCTVRHGHKPVLLTVDSFSNPSAVDSFLCTQTCRYPFGSECLDGYLICKRDRLR